MAKSKKKKNFANFSFKEAMLHLGIQKLHPWSLEIMARPSSPFFNSGKPHLCRLTM